MVEVYDLEKRKTIANICLQLVSYTEKEKRIDSINSNINITVNDNILAQCSSFLNNESDITKVDAKFNIGCTKIDFRFYLKEYKMKVSEL